MSPDGGGPLQKTAGELEPAEALQCAVREGRREEGGKQGCTGWMEGAEVRRSQQRHCSAR